MTTSLAAHVQLAHECCHRCQVQHEFGNLFRCVSSGLMHVCDSNCNQRVYYDRYNTICKISRKLHPPFEQDVAMDVPARKRSGLDSEPEEQLQHQDSWKRRQVAPQGQAAPPCWQ